MHALLQACAAVISNTERNAFNNIYYESHNYQILQYMVTAQIATNNYRHTDSLPSW